MTTEASADEMGLKIPGLYWQTPHLNWPIIIWFSVVHAVGLLGGLGYLVFIYCSLPTILLALGQYFFCHLSIRTGAHSLYSHRAFKAGVVFQSYVVIAFSAVFQDALIWWAARHRPHHTYTDKERDPHSILRGFWWAHMRWMLYKPVMPPAVLSYRDLVPDLMKNKFIWFQHKHARLIGVLVGFVAPTLIASLWGDPIGGFLVGGFLRLVFQYHGTWYINSVSHSVGPQPNEGNTSRNSPWWLMVPAAILTVGESVLHGKHHEVPWDFRIGTRWYHIDPGKWLIVACSWVGITWDLRRAEDPKGVTA